MCYSKSCLESCVTIILLAIMPWIYSPTISGGTGIPVVVPSPAKVVILLGDDEVSGSNTPDQVNGHTDSCGNVYQLALFQKRCSARDYSTRDTCPYDHHRRLLVVNRTLRRHDLPESNGCLVKQLLIRPGYALWKYCKLLSGEMTSRRNGLGRHAAQQLNNYGQAICYKTLLPIPCNGVVPNQCM